MRRCAQHLYFILLLLYVVTLVCFDRRLFEWTQWAHNWKRTRANLQRHPEARGMFNFNRPLHESSSPGKYTPVILMWQPIFGWLTNHANECPGCVMTYDQSTVTFADAVVFHCVEITDGVGGLPLSRRNTSSRWVWTCKEPPWNVRYRYEKTLTPLNGVFNWTMTYRTDSDVLAPFAYDFPTITRAELQRVIKAKVAKSLGAWVVSNCDVSERQKLVDELRKYISIDEFGQCANRRVASVWSVVSRYKFYFALENSRCKDYITEKFWYNGLGGQAVPVVMGPSRADYELVAPPHSFVHVDDFASARQLAEYLIELDQDDVAYSKYLEWRLDSDWKAKRLSAIPKESSAFRRYAQDPSNSGVCGLCSKLLDSARNNATPRVVDDLDQWWFGRGYTSAMTQFPICDVRSGVSGYSNHWIVTASYSGGFLLVALLIFFFQRFYQSPYFARFCIRRGKRCPIL